MRRRRNRVPSTSNDRWYERYAQGGYFCLPRPMLLNILDYIDNATFYVYVALTSCHYEGNTTYAGPHIAKLTGKDERAVRGHLADLETLGLIRRELLGRGYKILFECPTRARLKEGAGLIEAHKLEISKRRMAAKELRAASTAVE